MLLTSPDTLGNTPDPALVQVLAGLKSDGNPVALVSNHDKPNWFEAQFQGSGVQFIKEIGRQNGQIIAHNAAILQLQACDVIVLAGGDSDMRMGKNGGAVVVAAGWNNNRYVNSLGIRVENAQELQEVIKLTSTWGGQWWYAGSRPFYSIKALANLSTYGQQQAQEVFARRLTSTVKQGGSKLNSLLAITTRSLMMDGVAQEKSLVWGVYPSSRSDNNDTEVLSDFTHRLRTTVSRVRNAKRGAPLFIRHTPSAKRSTGGGGDRTDPSEQIGSIHINPEYKGALHGKHVIVIDDCTTYGVSFAVAAAFLQKAGAAKVTGIALGKFGNQLRHYDIAINSDPFVPVQNYTVNATGSFPGDNNNAAQQDLRSLV